MLLDIGLLAISYRISVLAVRATFRICAVLERSRILIVESETTATDLAANVFP